jgi:legumain
VKERTSNFNNYALGSHVMQYGDTNITDEKLYLYQGFDPATVNLPPHNGRLEAKIEVVNQRDAEILFMWKMVFSLNINLIINQILN